MSEIMLKPEEAYALRDKLAQLNLQQDHILKNLNQYVSAINADWSGEAATAASDSLAVTMKSAVSITNIMNQYIDAFTFAIQTIKTADEVQSAAITKAAEGLGVVAGTGAAAVAAASGEKQKVFADNAENAGFTKDHVADGVSPVPGLGPIDKDKEGFGLNRNGSDAATNGHSGYDFVAPEGTKVVSPYTGTIVQCKLDSTTVNDPDKGYGNYVIVEYDIGGKKYYAVFAHLQYDPKLKIGSPINAGDQIGCIGQTGGANNEPHLHFDVRCALDPTKELSGNDLYQYSRGQYNFIDPEIFFDELGVSV